MSELTANFIGDAVGWGQGFVAWFLVVLPTLKIISLGISGLFIFATGYSLYQIFLNQLYSDDWLDRMGVKDLPLRRARRAWTNAVRFIQNRNDRAQWVSALGEADGVINEGFKLKGYAGATINERLESATEAGALASLEDIQKAHTIFKQASQQKDFSLSHDVAVETLRRYKKGIIELGFAVDK